MSKRGMLHTFLLATYLYFETNVGLKRKRERDVPGDVATILMKFMEKLEEVELKCMQLEAEREERRREQERKHEERMMMMMAGALQQLQGMPSYGPMQLPFL